jgi:hypothetical protein
MSMSTSSKPPPLNEEQQQQQQTHAQHTQRLLSLHQKLTTLTHTLLLPASSSSPSPTPLLHDLHKHKAALTALLQEIESSYKNRPANTPSQDKDTKKEEQEKRRERYLSYCMDVYVDELDALRKDPSFKGGEEDVKAIIAMLEEGMGVGACVCGCEKEGECGCTGVGVGEEEEEEEEEGKAKEPVHVRLRREREEGIGR